MLENTRKLKEWLSEQKCRTLTTALNRRNFKAAFCADGDAAASYILKEAENANSIGFGGSLSVADLMLTDRLSALGKELLNHGLPDLTAEQKRTILQRQQSCDLFLSGVNAATIDGCLVNIDGLGNRVSAMIYGPEKVILVVGRNKIVEGDIADAIERIKNDSAPANTRRLNKKTPCAQTGICCDCDSPERICRVTTILEYKPSATDIHVLVVNQDMGL